MKTINFNQKNINYILRDEVDDSIFNEIFKYREYRQTEEIIKKASGAIIDVGAHAGFFSLYTAALNPSVKICALEPEPANFSALEENIKLNPEFNRIRLFNIALSSKTGETTLYLSPDSHNHSLLEEMAKTGKKSKVRSTTLGNFCTEQKISRIALLKMDIEGGEHDIIKNLDPTEFDLIDYLFLEVHKTESDFYESLEMILRPAGFSVQIFPCQFATDLKFILARNKRKNK